MYRYIYIYAYVYVFTFYMCVYVYRYIHTHMYTSCMRIQGFPNVKVYVARRPVLGKFFWFIDLARLVDGERGVG